MDNILSSALNKIYCIMYQIDINNNAINKIFSPKYLENHTAKYTKAHDCLSFLAKILFLPAYQPLITKFYDISTLPERLKEKDIIHIDAPTLENKWLRTNFIVAMRNNREYPTHIILAIQNANDIRTPLLPEINEKLDNKLIVKCFGDFEIYYHGIPLSFKHKKTKELFAYLIDRHCAEVTTQKILCVLWEDDKNHINYYQTLRNDLITTLRKLPFKVINVNYGTLSVYREAISCDYFDCIEGKHNIKYLGEYMEQYSWGEYSKAFLDRAIIS